MDRAQSYQDYQTALKRGQRYMQSHMARGENPSMPVLDEILSGVSTAGTVLVGTVEIPIDRVVGTVARGRTNAFAGNFMPLLPPDTEFAGKWVTLHKAHMEEGISDPILCTEYKGMFYVQEGHKRVSVLRFFEAATVLATVRRTIPAWDDTPEVQAYYEFMHFYKLSGTYRVFFDEPGCYEKLQNAIGFAPDHEWSEEERLTFSSVYWRFKRQWRRLQRPETENISPEKAFLTYLELYRNA